jgi:hypothetical protein
MDGNISKSKSQSNKKKYLEKNTNYSLNIINPNFHKVKKYNILYIKATVVYVCVGSAWKILPVTVCSLWSPFPVCGDKQGRVGRPGQPLRGAGRGAISIKEILGENRGTCI